ncbi:hypothetical protein PFISCL1PPCAC_9336, partial [Pristionchus fissidentatus]
EMNSSFLLLLASLPLIICLNQKEITKIQELRKGISGELLDFYSNDGLFPALHKIYSDFQACKIGADELTDRLLKMNFRRDKNEQTRDEKLNLIAAYLAHVDTLVLVRNCKQQG